MKSCWCYFLYLIFPLLPYSVSGQGGIWTWISGDSTINPSSVFGTQGVPSVNNHPRGSYEYVEWKDKQGNFWVYGGTHPDGCDLWMFNPTNLEWTWVKGNGLTNQGPVYGILGVPDPANTPGERTFGTSSWVDTTGNLWLFGGGNYFGDLWRYEIATNEWTWMSGSSFMNAPGVHGVQGIPSVNNCPGGRYETCTAWTDTLNQLWLFGGEGLDDNYDAGFLNDLMKYNIATNEWTWMHGSAIADSVGYYGQQGVPDPANMPSGRVSYSKYKDLAGNLWIIGGGRFAGEVMNDIWRFDTGSNLWTWMDGPSITRDTGAYLNTCIYDPALFPQSRFEHRSSVTDHKGRFWLYGGLINSEPLNDLWIYDPAILEWNWIHGSNAVSQPGNHGTLGIPAPTNIPSGRAGSVAWWGNDNRFYLFAGSVWGGALTKADMWVFTPDTICTDIPLSLPVAAFQADTNSVCPGACIDFDNFSSNAITYSWSFPGGNPSSSNALNPLSICYSLPGSYDVSLIASNANSSDSITLFNYVTVFPYPVAQAIYQSGDTLFANQGTAGYQWYLNGILIPGATDYYYVASQNGDYNLITIDTNGCEVEVAIYDVITKVNDNGLSDHFTIVPNPTTGNIYIDYSDTFNNRLIHVSIHNALSEKLFDADLKKEISHPLEINISNLKAGLYFMEVNFNQKGHLQSHRTKIIKY